MRLLNAPCLSAITGRLSVLQAFLTFDWCISKPALMRHAEKEWPVKINHQASAQSPSGGTIIIGNYFSVAAGWHFAERRNDLSSKMHTLRSWRADPQTAACDWEEQRGEGKPHEPGCCCCCYCTATQTEVREKKGWLSLWFGWIHPFLRCHNAEGRSKAFFFSRRMGMGRLCLCDSRAVISTGGARDKWRFRRC